MNALRAYILRYHGTKDAAINKVLNTLQENGIISDECITLADVAEADCARAVDFLEGKLDPNQIKLL
jgi:hypothetical protein